MNALENWMKKATPEQTAALAEKSGTSVANLRHIAKGRRNASAALACRLEQATIAVRESNNGELPVIYRTALSEACRGCEFARRCLSEGEGSDAD